MPLDTPLGPGEERALDADFYNDLVAALTASEAPGPMALRASTERVLVGADDAVVPAAVTVADISNYGVYDPSNVTVTWSLQGPGALDTLSTSGRGVVTWTWAGADWDAALPDDIVITASSSVDVGAGATFIDAHKVTIVADRAYDPDYADRFGARLSPQADSVAIAGASAALVVDDPSEFPGAVSVTRTLSATWEDGSSDLVTVADRYAEGETWLDAADRAIDLVASREGVVTIRADYDVDGTVTTVRRQVRVWARAFGALPALGEATAPRRVALAAGNGRLAIEVGTPVDVVAIEDAGAWTAPTDAVRETALAALTQAEGVAPIVDATGAVTLKRDDARLLADAGAAIKGLLAPLSGRLRLWNVTLAKPEGSSAAIDDLVGQTIYASAAGHVLQLRLRRLVSGGTRPVYEAAGRAETEALPIEAVATASADLVTVRVECGYGEEDNHRFTFTTQEAIDPDAGLGRLSVYLPEQVPASEADGWWARATVFASYTGGPATTKELAWQRAERPPVGAPELSIEPSAFGDVVHARVGGAYRFFGGLAWQDDPEASGDPGYGLPAPLASETMAVPSHALVGVWPVAHGHLRALGGTAGPPVTVVGPRTKHPGWPLTKSATSGNPRVAAPEQVTFYQTTTGLFVSTGEWHQISGIGFGGSSLKLDEVQVKMPEGVFTPATRSGLNTFEMSVPDGAYAGTIQMRFVFAGGVDAARIVHGPSVTSAFDKANQTLTADLAVSHFPVGSHKFIMRATPQAGEDAAFTFEFTREAVADTDGPVVTSVLHYDTESNPLSVEEAGPARWKLVYDANVHASTDALVYFKDVSGVTNAVVTSGTGLTSSFDASTRKLEISGLAGRQDIGVRATDAWGNTTDIVLALYRTSDLA